MVLGEVDYAEDRFVFKSCDQASATIESDRLRRLPRLVETSDNEFRFPRLVDILDGELPGTRVLVLSRVRGQTLEEKSLRRNVSFSLIERVTTFLARIHGALVNEGDLGRRGDIFRFLRRCLRFDAISMPNETTEALIEQVRVALAPLPSIPKRDAHPGNWLVDDSGITAVDLSSRGTRPLLYELIQLVEDGAMLPPDTDGLQARLDLANLYLTELRAAAPSSYGDRLDLSSSQVLHAMAGAMICRGAFSISFSGRSVARDRQLSQIAHGVGLMELVQRMNGVGDLSETAATILDQYRSTERRRRRRSTLMGTALRHNGDGLVDDQGWASIAMLQDALAEYQGGALDGDQIRRVAQHPAEDRFETDGPRMRARYGHSIDVELGLEAGQPPATLFHGTSQDSVPSITENGLLPMGRRFVHLVDDPGNARKIGRRHGEPVVLEIDAEGASASGIKFLQATGSLWLVLQVPARFVRQAEV